ncbi:MAG: UvrD-helicase domain-containing protein [Bacteroidia bacterium]|nr:UvrD-helicase domain-containing protein [Bacteroidia bacterium]
MGLVIYTSSAGSGKTFTLVHQFLIKVIERPWLFRRILAITFTNKATEELKSRIIRELDNLAKGGSSRHLELLLRDLPKLSEADIRGNAGLVLTKILHDYSSFSVSTIDSYFQILARTLARELQLPMKYEIELDTESICQHVTELLLDEAGKDPFITRWLEDLLLHRIENGKNWNVRSELEKMTRQLLQSEAAREHARHAGMADLPELINWMIRSRKEIEQFMRISGNKGLEIIRNNGLDINRFYQKQRGPAGYLQKIAGHRSGFKEFDGINSYTQNCLEDPLAFLAKADQQDERLCRIVSEELHPVLEKAVVYFTMNRRKYISVTEALKLIYQSGITGALDKKLIEFREQNQLFHLSDTTRMLSKSVADQDAPFIFEKSGNTYQHIFIDEFQDTATEQWNILKPLVINTLSTGNDVLIVGDAKQSIYRWRGGNMQLILEGVRREINHTGFPVEERMLGTNWRSKENIVHFNNAFFPNASGILAAGFEGDEDFFRLAYSADKVEQKTKEEGAEGGFISFNFIASEKPAKGEEEDVPKWKEKALHYMDSCIGDLLEKGYHPGDIVILVRTNKHESEIADHLFKEGKYPFISSNSLLLSRQRQVLLLLNCLRLLLTPKEALLHEEINRAVHEMLGLPPEKNDFPFLSIHRSTFRPERLTSKLLSRRDELICLPLNQVLSFILDVAGLALNDPFVQKFCDLVQDYVSSTGNNIAGFIQWWDDHEPTRKWSVDLADSGNALRIITIHRSKGLEFPIVMLPFLDWEITPTYRDILWAEAKEEKFAGHGKLPLAAVKSLATSYFEDDYYQESLHTAVDNLNLLYVAFTRPEEKLFVCGPAKPAQNNACRLLIEALSSMQNNTNIRFEVLNDTLQIGTNDAKKSQKKKIESASLYQPQGFNPAETTMPVSDQLSLPDLKTAFSSDEIILGNLVHEAISQVNEATDIERSIDLTLAKNGNLAYSHMKAQMQEAVRAVWKILVQNRWTKDHYEVINECDLCDEDGRLHRPDKVLLTGSEGIVIDFKTGKREERHDSQVSEYCRLLKASGVTNLSAYLIYTSDLEIVKVV